MQFNQLLNTVTSSLLTFIKKTIEIIISLINYTPTALDLTLTYIIRVLRTILSFFSELFHLLQPTFSFGLLLRTAFNLGVISKLIAFLPFTPLLSFPAFVVAFATEYNGLMYSAYTAFREFFQNLSQFILQLQNEVLQKSLLETKVDFLEKDIEIRENNVLELHKSFLKIESELKAQITHLSSNLDVTKDHNNRLLVTNELLQKDLAIRKSVTHWDKQASALSIGVQIITTLTTLYSIFGQGNLKKANMDEITTSLKVVLAAVQQMQRNNMDARNASRSAGTAEQLTRGNARDLDDYSDYST